MDFSLLSIFVMCEASKVSVFSFILMNRIELRFADLALPLASSHPGGESKTEHHDASILLTSTV